MGSRSQLAFVTFLTIVRFPLVIAFFVLALLFHETGGRHEHIFWLALFSLVASAVTDIFDGYYARKFDVTTKFGSHVDPLMDKFFYLTTMPLLVYVSACAGMKDSREIHHALFLLIMTVMFLARDQWVTFLRSIGSIYNASGKADWSGKLRTIINFPLMCAAFFYLQAPAKWNFIAPIPWLLYAFEGLAFLVNLWSIYTYTARYWPYLLRAADPAVREDKTERGQA